MANSISDTLQTYFNKLPSSLQGNGQNFIFLLKDMLKALTGELNSKFEEISKIANSITDAPDTISEQLKNCKVTEKRIGTNITLTLTWDYSGITNYDGANIYVKESKDSIPSWDSIGISKTISTAKTDTYIIDGCNAGTTYRFLFKGKNTYGSVSEESAAPVLLYSVSSLNNVPDSPTEFNCYVTKEGLLWKWKQPVDIDYSVSELRTDTNPGNSVNLLEVTQDCTSSVQPSAREGIAYLYNKGYGSKYSEPATTTWSKPVAIAPQGLTVTPTFQGLQITYGAIPEDCIGIVIYVNNSRHLTSDTNFNYYCSTGSYTVKAAYYDSFGEGTMCEPVTISTIENVPIADNQILLKMLDTTVQTAVADAQNSVTRLDSIDTGITSINQSISDLQVSDNEIKSTIASNKTAQDSVNSSVSTDISQIKQTSDSISATVQTNKTTQDGVNKAVSDDISQIKQDASGLSSTVQSNKSTQDTVNKTVNDSISQIKQTASELSTTVQTNKTDQDSVNKSVNDSISQIKQNADSISATVQANKKSSDDTDTELSSKITQNSDSVTSIVTNLNRTAGESGYSALTQLSNDVNLRVSKNDVINQINISTEGIKIAGNTLHITGDTLFDNKIIVGQYIGDKEIAGTKIADNTISTGNIAAGAITANEIATNAVTSDKVIANAITSDKIAVNAVTSDKLTANSVTADKLAVNSVTADKLAANTINLAGALKVVGGNVTLDESGLTVAGSDDNQVLFNGSGVVYKSSTGGIYNVLGKMATGSLSDGQTVHFKNAWQNIPNITLVPQNIQISSPDYSLQHINLHVYADNITNSGFTAHCYTSIYNSSGSFSCSVLILNGNWDYHYGISDYGSISGNVVFNVSGAPSKVTVNGHITITRTVSEYDSSPGSEYTSSANIKAYSGSTLVGETNVTILNYENINPGTANASKSVSFSVDINGSNLSNLTFVTTANLVNTQSRVADYFNGQAYIDSYTTYISGEQKLNSGTCLFLATDQSNANNYTIS